jgi:tetratricopeptide (TPR) repeat protein
VHFDAAVQKQLSGDIVGAIDDYQKALGVNMSMFEAAYNLGLCYLQQNKLAHAQHAFESSAKANGLYKPTYAHLSEIYRKQNMEPEAKNAWMHYLEL